MIYRCVVDNTHVGFASDWATLFTLHCYRVRVGLAIP